MGASAKAAVLAALAGLCLPGSLDAQASRPGLARKAVTIKTGTGLIQSVTLENSGKQSAFGCSLWGQAAKDHQGMVIWRLTARGTPGWSEEAWAIEDDQGRKFEWFCHREATTQGRVFSFRSMYLGPADARNLTVRFGATAVKLAVPPPPGERKVEEAPAGWDRKERFRAAFALKEKGRCGEALRILEEIIRRVPDDDPTIDYEYGWACYCAARAAQFEKTVQYYRVMRDRYTGEVSSIHSTGVRQTRNWDDRLAEVRKILAASQDPKAVSALQTIRRLDREAGVP